LYRVRAPTLIVHGEHDAFVPAAYADDFVRALPNATAEIIPGGAHMLPIEDTDAVDKAVRGFLEAHS
jgi:pimeloyl-ACP methyl ester carboxylesterase